MKSKKIPLLFLTLLFVNASVCQALTKPIYAIFKPDGVPFVVAETAWKADLLGNHRAVVELKDNTDVARVVLPWRRADKHPESKKIIIVDAKSGEEVKSVFIKELTSEKGEIIFEPIKGVTKYNIYYMPYKFRKGWDDARYGEPWNDYLPAQYNNSSEWENKVKQAKKLKEAKLLRFESRSEFDRLAPMGLIATKKETEKIRAKHTQNPIVFIEDRLYPISLKQNLPARWATHAVHDNFEGVAMRNEYYVWQLGLWAAHDKIKNVKLAFSDLQNGDAIISKKQITCFNQEGINWDGNPITFNVNIIKNNIQAMWCGVQIPKEAKIGEYKGVITVCADGMKPQEVHITIKVEKEILIDCGDGDLWRHSRLRWLNSTIGIDSSTVTPYKPLQIENRTIVATDKKIELSSNGLLSSVTLNDRELLASPMTFVIDLGNKEVIFKASNLRVMNIADGLIEWTAFSEQEGITFNLKASLEYDGYIRYNVNLSAAKKIEVKDIKLLNTYETYASKYFMGIGYKGGFTPININWRWNGPYDSYWIGNEMIGLHVEYRGGSYHGPLLNDYKPAPSPVWSNDRKGSIKLGVDSGRATVIASTGENTIDQKPLDFEFALLITPVRKVETSKHFSERYFHADPSMFNLAAEELANIVNIHHARSLNPVINYPFIARDSLTSFINYQHEYGRKVKLYYTVRELSNYVKEIHALYSLNHEIFVTGRGYGIPWLQEHLIDDYKAAWYTELPNETSDAALVLNSFSRWINYYLEGLKWMLINYKIDGIYMDDVSFDRNVMKRMRKIFEQYHPGALIDLHSNTDYSKGPMNQYTDFFPYIDRLWFGEHFRYNEMNHDEWFVTFSGIPFGLMSEMLQDGGNQFLGMVYGATARHSYESNKIYHNPYPIWKLWQSFGIENAKMIGYWNEECPIETNEKDVKATVYQKDKSTLIAIGNFSNKTTSIKLAYNWKALGIDPSTAKITAPDIEGLQKGTSYTIDETFQINGKEGKLLIISQDKTFNKENH